MPRNRFFLWASLLMLASVVFAFGPTYYFRSFSGRNDISGSPDLPGYLLVHGAVLTAWFCLPVLQTGLVALGRTDLHRRLGIVGVGVALAVIGMSALVVLRSVPRLKSAGFSEIDMGGIVVGDLTTLPVFALMVTVAILQRNRPDVHRRWMFLSSTLFLGPLVARMMAVWQMPVLAIAFSPPVWIIALIVHDVRSLRRVHSATLWASGIVIASLTLGGTLGRTSAAHNLLVSLGL